MTNQIAETTLQQLGGSGRLSAMIGASKFAHSKDGALTFHFKGFKKANVIKIELDKANDVYVVSFYKYNQKTFDCPMVAQYTWVYADDLKNVIEIYTGLHLSL
jgi:hypothetical protein